MSACSSNTSDESYNQKSGDSYYSSNESDNSSPTHLSYDKIEKEEELNGDFTWYRYKINGKFGALNSKKEVLIDALYDGIGFDDHSGKFHVDLDGFWGLINPDGSTFISVDRGYNYIFRGEISNNRVYYDVRNSDGLSGICDKNGREIIKPEYDYIYYMDLVQEDDESVDFESFYVEDDGFKRFFYIYLDQNSDIKRFPKPLYEKIYTRSSWYHKNDGTVTYDNDDKGAHVRIYNDRILFGSYVCPYYNTDNGSRIYIRTYSDGEEKSYLYLQNGVLIEETPSLKVMFNGNEYNIAQSKKEKQASPITRPVNDYPANQYNAEPIQNNPQSSTLPKGHYETRIEQCIDCQGRGYNEKMVWHGGDKTSTVRIRCSFCHGKGTIERREYVMDY